ncbi:MAG: redoxin protein [Alphaproteobacteria bacterium]|nr:redoxin protein [Alphaproteobacteria bacterium]
MSISKPLPGDLAPWFKARALDGQPNYAFDTVGGRHVLMLFFGSSQHIPSAAALRLAGANRPLFDDIRACFFGITIDPSDESEQRVRQQLPGVRFFLDFDHKVSALYGADSEGSYEPCWLVLDQQLRVIGRFPIDRGDAAIACLKTGIASFEESQLWAPAVLVPQVFEPELCRTLIGLYEKNGGRQSGFMRDVDGKTTEIHDPAFKQRRDFMIDDAELQKGLAARLRRRLVPALKRAYAFDVTRVERYLVACYEAGAGHFRAHRDNTTKGTAHRRFAVTINLNADEYDGGDLRFPEYGARTYRAPTGGAIVFSCSMLHEATPVTSGARYAFLPFLYDENAAKIRKENRQFLDGGSGKSEPSVEAKSVGAAGG